MIEPTITYTIIGPSHQPSSAPVGSEFVSDLFLADLVGAIGAVRLNLTDETRDLADRFISALARDLGTDEPDDDMEP